MYDPLWLTRDGRRMHLWEMSESHIVNCIRMIERNNDWRRKWLPRLNLELDIRRMGMNSGRRAPAS